MDKEQTTNGGDTDLGSQSEPVQQSEPQPQPRPQLQPVSQPARPTKPEFSENVKAIRRVCSYVTISATTVFAFMALLSIWADLGGDIIWKSFASLAVVGFGALIVAAVAPLADKR